MTRASSNRSLPCWWAPTLFLLTSLATNGSASAAGQKPIQEPIVVQREATPEEMTWSPIFSNQKLLPMSPEVHEAFEGIKGGRPESFEKTVRLAYRLMEGYGRSEGHDISIQVSDFKTFAAPGVWALKVSDLFSFGPSEYVSITGIHHEEIFSDPRTHKSRKTSFVGYKMEWAPALPDPDLKLWMKRSVRDYVEIAKADQPALSLLRAVTTYRVSLTFAGKHKDYRAAFWWMGGATPVPPVLTFHCSDLVLNRVTLALAEQIPPGVKKEEEIPYADTQENKPISKFLPVCNVYTRYPQTGSFEHHGFERHVGNFFHQAFSQVDASCSCSSACESICRPSVSVNLCFDQGNTIGGYHVGAIDFRPTAGTREDALNVPGAFCQGIVGCAFAQCPVSDCLFSISIGTSGPTFTSNPTNAMVFWSFVPTTTVTCGSCTEYQGPVEQPQPPPEENCPLLIALDEGRLEMTDLAGGVRFDLNRDGTAEHNSWPAASSSWAFVALDRNFNGRIDNGGELFGNYTNQYLDDRPPNGYAALAAYDRPENGGNGDGVLDDRDAIFPSLLLWTDANHDGVSQPQELAPLAERVEEIGLDYRESRSRDRYGNQFRYRGTVRLAGGRRSRSVDVFLLHD